MLDEIALKKAQAEQARAELERRSAEAQDAMPSQGALPARNARSGDDMPDETTPGVATRG
jgi:hypothetical protein